MIVEFDLIMQDYVRCVQNHELITIILDIKFKVNLFLFWRSV